jgi:riboflavin synthase
MFTGIIREKGTLRQVSSSSGGARLRIEAPRSRPALQKGGSIAVDGVCLTVVSLDAGCFSADVVPETLSRTRLGEARVGDRLNLELPLTLGQFLDGHLVQGHVDGVGTVVETRSEGSQTLVRTRVDSTLAPYLAEKGSVAVNGVSLTVTGVTEDTFSVALIPTTLKETNLDELRSGSRVNVEIDLLARYVARLHSVGVLAHGRSGPGLTRDQIQEMGY